MKARSYKVIFDTNVWISFIIGKRLAFLKTFIVSGQITIVFSKRLLQELTEVTNRPKLKKYFPSNEVEEMLEFIKTIGLEFNPESIHTICRDEKDNFLLDLIDVSKANFLVSGDKDLKELNPFKTAKILTPAEFTFEMDLENN
jgi:putative PIN family toxin of toxin-antitoxin system